MGRRRVGLVFGILVFILLVGAFGAVLNAPVVKGDSGTIYIRADGSIDPPTPLITTADNVTYTLTGNITSDADGIVVERSNTIIDGAGYKVQGTSDWESYESKGICLDGISNVTIKNVHITESYYGVFLNKTSYSVLSGDNITNSENGIYLHHSSNCSISGNNITNNRYGISLGSSSDNSISGNNITANDNGGIGLAFSSSGNIISGNNITNNRAGTYGYGIYLLSSNYNIIYHNNFVDNAQQVYCYDSINVWDDGYPSGGNYWSDYTGVDLHSGSNQTGTGSDSIGDTPHVIDESNTDRYPLMAPYSTFDAGTWNETAYDVDVVSNSTVSNFHFNPDGGPFLEFNVTGQEGTVGFCRVAIPKSLLWAEDGQWIVLVGGVPLTNYTITSDENHSYLYFTYDHSTKTVQIQGTHAIPEFPSFLVLPLFMIATLLAVIVYRRKHAMNE